MAGMDAMSDELPRLRQEIKQHKKVLLGWEQNCEGLKKDIAALEVKVQKLCESERRDSRLLI